MNIEICKDCIWGLKDWCYMFDCTKEKALKKHEEQNKEEYKDSECGEEEARKKDE